MGFEGHSDCQVCGIVAWACIGHSDGGWAVDAAAGVFWFIGHSDCADTEAPIFCSIKILQ